MLEFRNFILHSFNSYEIPKFKSGNGSKVTLWYKDDSLFPSANRLPPAESMSMEKEMSTLTLLSSDISLQHPLLEIWGSQERLICLPLNFATPWIQYPSSFDQLSDPKCHATREGTLQNTFVSYRFGGCRRVFVVQYVITVWYNRVKETADYANL